MATKHKTQYSHIKSIAKQHVGIAVPSNINCSYILSPHAEVPDSGEHLAQHIAGLSKFCQKL